MSTRTTAQSEGLSSGGAAIGTLLSSSHVLIGASWGVRSTRLRRPRTGLTSTSQGNSLQRSLYGQECRSALVLDQEHHEFRRLRTARVPVNDMNIVGPFIEGLSWCQCYLFSTLHLHYDGPLQHVKYRMCIVSV